MTARRTVPAGLCLFLSACALPDREHPPQPEPGRLPPAARMRQLETRFEEFSPFPDDTIGPPTGLRPRAVAPSPPGLAPTIPALQ